MSYFLTGYVRFTQALSPDEQVNTAFELSERALRSRVGIQLGCNIVQKIVFEILDKDLATKRALPFLLTGSPISDTSDDLLNYWSESRAQMKTKVKSNAERLQNFIASLRSIPHIAGVALFVSEGYDTSYRKENVTIELLASRFIELAEEYDWAGFPSVELFFQLAETHPKAS
jgi:hypothetical protein